MEKQDPQTLEEIRREFSRRQGKPIAQELRALVLSALSRGYSAREIAHAAGISRQSIKNWQRQIPGAEEEPAEAPVELKLVDERREIEIARVEEKREAVAIARIVLCSGVTVELPACAIDSRLFSVLNTSAP